MNKKKKETDIEEENKVSAHLTGIVWEKCKLLQNFKIENGYAIHIEFNNRQLPLLKDATKELDELLLSQNENNSSNKKEDNDDDDDFIDDFEDETVTLTEEEKRIIPLLINLFKCSYAILKKLADILAKGNFTIKCMPPNIHSR